MPMLATMAPWTDSSKLPAVLSSSAKAKVLPAAMTVVAKKAFRTSGNASSSVMRF